VETVGDHGSGDKPEADPPDSSDLELVRRDVDGRTVLVVSQEALWSRASLRVSSFRKPLILPRRYLCSATITT